MPFDWSDYRLVAEKLSQNADEASLRCAISRAYYFAYHQAVNHLSEHFDFLPSKDKSHDAVWRAFEKKGHSYREVWDKGDKLKKLRVDADYESDAIIRDETAAFSLQLSDRIAAILQVIHRQKSVRPS